MQVSGCQGLEVQVIQYLSRRGEIVEIAAQPRQRADMELTTRAVTLGGPARRRGGLKGVNMISNYYGYVTADRAPEPSEHAITVFSLLEGVHSAALQSIQFARQILYIDIFESIPEQHHLQTYS